MSAYLPSGSPPPMRRAQRALSLFTISLLLLQLLQMAFPSLFASPTASAAPAEQPGASSPAPNALFEDMRGAATFNRQLAADDFYRAPARSLLPYPELVDLREEYARHFDLGGGEYAAVISPTPLHYRDRSGRWQPVEPAFEAIPGGWWVGRNSLRSALFENSTDVQLEAAGVPLGWRYTGLEVALNNNLAISYAQPLAPDRAAAGLLSADARSVRHAAVWSQAGLAVLSQSEPGALRQTFSLAAAPQRARFSAAERGWLSLEFDLEFPAGVQFFADGRIQRDDFTTHGALELRGLNGDPILTLLPPTAYEDHNPAAQIAGRLQVRSREGAVRIALQTPWAWWTAAGRQFPASFALAAFTPTMQVVKDLENATIGRTRDYDSDHDPIGPPNSPWGINQSIACVGNYVQKLGDEDYRLGLNRGYMRFPLPSLPQGVAQPSAAYVIAVPDNSLTADDPSHHYYGDNIARLPVYLLEMSADWTDDLLQPGQTTTNNFPIGMALPAVNDLRLIRKIQAGSPNTDQLPVTAWDVTGAVQGWYTNPSTNYGFALRAFYDEFHFFEDPLPPVVPEYPNFTHPTNMCFPASAAWSSLDSVVANLDNLGAATADGPGLGMLVTYSASQLAGDTIYRQIGVPSAIPLQSYRYQFHEYRLPTPQANRWQIVAVQGRTPNWDGLSPNTPLDLANENGDLLVTSDAGKASAANATWEWQPNYVVINGDQGQLGVRVQPDNQPADDLHDDKLYALQTEYANPSPALPVGQTTIVPLSIFREMVDTWELNLAADTTVEVRIPYTATVPAMSAAQAPYFDLQVFPPALGSAGRTNGGMPLTRGPDAYEIEFTVGDAQQGRWLLVMQSNREASNMDMPAQVTVCQNTDQVVRYPLEGECIELRRPPSNFASDPTYYKELGSGETRLRLYSPAGFDCAGSQCTSRPKDPNEVPVMPMLGYGSDAQHWVALKNGQYTLDTSANRIFTSPDSRLVMADFSDPNVIHSLPVLRGEFEAFPGDRLVHAVSAPVDTYLLVKSPLHVLDDKGGDGDKNGWQYEIDQDRDRLNAFGPLERDIQPTDGNSSVLLSFNADWSISVEGGPSLQGTTIIQSVGAPNSTFNVGTLLATAPDGGYTHEWNPQHAVPGYPAIIPSFHQIRVVGATIAQPANTGGAQLPVQAVLLPPGQNIKDENNGNPSVQCGESCFDLRGEDDAMTPSGPLVDREYTMPDLIIQDSANTVMVNTAGRLEVFSSDHPLANLSPTATDVSFSYEAFDSSVKTFYGDCPQARDPLDPGNKVGPPAEKATVVIGRASMSLPNASSGGDTSNGARIEVTFTLCSGSMREMGFTFDTGPDYAIPLGNSGLWLNLIGGTVSLTPKLPNTDAYTTVVLRFGFRGMSMAASASNLFFLGAITIDSRGLFDVQVQAGIQVSSLAGVGVDGHFWVAWSPLDLGYIVQACLPKTVDPTGFPYPSPVCAGNELLYGMLKMHVWQGQGWQHMYHWLPDDNQVHAAARFEAKITIATGMILEWGLAVIPPSDMTLLGIKLAFGEFCMNNSCTQFEWGVMGALTILGYDVGAYYGFDSGLSFIMGSADYVLIDEAGLYAASPKLLARQTVPFESPAFATADQQTTITLPAGLPSALFGLASPNAAVRLTLHEPPPGNRVITTDPPTPGSDLVIETGPTQIAFQVTVAITQPLPGDWLVEMDGIGAAPHNFFYFANNPAPDLQLSPLPQQALDQTTIPITWTSTISPAGAATMSLFYERVDAPLTYTQEVAGPIIQYLDLTPQGQYDWDITGMASGSYRVYARIDSNAAQTINNCPDQAYSNDPTQQSPCGLMLAQGLILPVERVDMPGTVRIRDTIPPAPPQGFDLRAEGLSSVVGRWQPNDENDLGGYIVTCNQGALQRNVRVPPTLLNTSPLSETARVNGLGGVPATCFALAYDVSGNTSAPSNSDTATPSAQIPLPPAAVGNIVLQPTPIGEVVVQWAPSQFAYAYWVYYFILSDDNLAAATTSAPALPFGVGGGGSQADQGPPPLVTGEPGITISGLRPGATYELWVVPVDAEGRAGPPSAKSTFTAPTIVPQLWLPLVSK